MTYPATLLDFYVASRALTRAKVGAIRARQTNRPDPDVARYVDLAHRHLVAAIPTVIIVGGLPGAGKSALSEAYARASGAVHLSSDEIRHGLVPHQRDAEAQPAWWQDGAYSRAMTAAVYDELLARAATAVSEGCSVVLDASWHDEPLRQRAVGIARLCGAAVVQVRCEIDETVAFRRLSRSRTGYSQAGAETRAHMKQVFAPWPEAAVIVTDRDVDDVVPDLQRVVADAVNAFVRHARSALATSLMESS